MTENFKSVLENILKKDKRLVDDNGELNGNLIHEYASSLDEGLIDLLLNEEATREKFFLKVKDVYVFKQNDLKFFLDENKIDNSYTQYANRIGLSTGGKFLKDIDDVVLDFPYKDCVLEGGQSTEEGTDTYFEYDEDKQDFIEKEATRKEIFFNQILAKDEIDRLTEPKAFTNIKRYGDKGEEKVTSFYRDGNGKITDNLIIKGNNLLALNALKEQFQGKIKLIYIDPPYNTGGDSFAYNDNFNHSAWLVFMRNRLAVARNLLSNNGVIFIQIDENELGYLKPIADEIFGRENFEIQINWQRTTQRSVLGQGATPIINIVEYILVYKKNRGNDNTLNKIQKIIPSNDKMYNQYNLLLETEGNRKLVKTVEHNGSEIKFYRHKDFMLKSIPISERTVTNYVKIFPKIVRKDSQQQESSLEQLIMSNIESDDTLYSVERVLKQGKSKGKLKKSLYMNNNVIYYLKDYADVVENKIFRKVDMNNLWLDYEISSAGIAKEGAVNLKRGKKPEELIKRIIEIGTNNEKDIVLDFHLGSGTTAAVAHKLKRQYIGIEQLDYGENDSTIRLKKVINSDKSGISNLVKWNGGGSFVYCELAKNNQKAINKIMSCESLQELVALFDELYEKYFLNYNVKVKEFRDKIVIEKAFQNLPLDRQKEIFACMLDLNQLYVNVSDMEDSQFKLSDEDIALTKNFYQL